MKWRVAPQLDEAAARNLSRLEASGDPPGVPDAPEDTMSNEFDDLPKRGYLMRGLLYAFYWMDEGMQNHMRAAGYEPLSRTQSMIMTNVGDGMTRPSELARNLGVSRQAVHQLLADMEARNLVELIPDPSDARAKIVRFSRRGKDIGRVALQATANMEALIAERIGKKSLTELKRILLETEWGAVADPSPKKTVRKAATKAPAKSAAKKAAARRVRAD